jgi:dihydrofolate reductase
MINAIFAMDTEGGIGKDGTLPWPRNERDLRWFKNQTMYKFVVMGRNTWDDPMFPKPLPNRHNVVISSRGMSVYPDTSVVTITDARKWLMRNHDKEIFIIGGAKVLNDYWDMVDKFYVTQFNQSYDCDTFINEDNLKILNDKEIAFEQHYEELSFYIRG